MLKNVRLYWLAGCFALTIFVSAFLVFQVQPVISKTILPWFGGAPAVWTTCMLFFQVLLFLGYTYAHLLTRWARPMQQGVIHLCLIVAALMLLPITPGPEWKPADSSFPTLRILLLLAANVGAPYFLLSSTGPLVQAWFSRVYEGRSPYRLYALSNVGSLLALLSYPFLVEPALTTHTQGSFWSVGFCLFALGCGYLAVRLWQSPRTLEKGVAPGGRASCGGADERVSAESKAPAGLNEVADAAPATPCGIDYAWWLALPAFASMMLLATTNHVCQDVAVVPFLWVVPLSLYLISFIICFDNEAWYNRFWFGTAAVAVIVTISMLTVFAESQRMILETVLYFIALFLICMLCHGELVRRKPPARYLTAFYLMCSAGGAVGGIFVAVICPLVFNAYWETPIGTIVAYAMAAVVVLPELARRFKVANVWEGKAPAEPQSGPAIGAPSRPSTASGDPAAEDKGQRSPISLWTATAAITLFAGFLAVVSLQLRSVHMGAEVSVRNFYGVLHVDRSADEPDCPESRVLIHGRIVHGLQFDAPEKRRVPTTYYAPTTGIGLVMQQYPGDEPRRVGLVGLGVGTLAAYGRQGDYYRFYEINPDVIRLARENFTFLSDTPANIDVVLGDARLSLEREPDQRYDVLVLDAFSGDAIPVHLLTREAFAVYRRHLKPDGVLAVNISNRHLNLVPVLAGLARHDDYEWLQIRNKTDIRSGTTAAHWMVLTRNEHLLSDKVLRRSAEETTGQYAHTPIWTDDFNNLLTVLK